MKLVDEISWSAVASTNIHQTSSVSSKKVSRDTSSLSLQRDLFSFLDLHIFLDLDLDLDFDFDDDPFGENFGSNKIHHDFWKNLTVYQAVFFCVDYMTSLHFHLSIQIDLVATIKMRYHAILFLRKLMRSDVY